MDGEELNKIAEAYPPENHVELLDIAQQYRLRSEREVLEVAALASDVSFNSVTSLGLEPDANPQLLEAFELQYPTVNIESLRGQSEEFVQRYVNGVKGKYFEVLVRDGLNDGERLGELQLEPGQFAKLADSPTQAGWDLQIVNGDGSIAEEIQLKASESLSYIRKALDKYPDIRVAAPSEIDDSPDEILGIDITDQKLTQDAQAQLEELREGPIEDFLDSSLEAALDSLPIVSALVTGVIEGRNVLAGRSTIAEAIQRGARRVGKSAAYDALAAATGLGLAAVGLRVIEGRVSARVAGRTALGDRLAPRTEELRLLAG